MSCDDSVIASTGHLSVQDTLYVISFDPVSDSTGEFYSLVIELGRLGLVKSTRLRHKYVAENLNQGGWLHPQSVFFVPYTMLFLIY